MLWEGDFLFFFFAELHSMWDLSHPTKDQAGRTCLARWIPNHWATREAPLHLFLFLLVFPPSDFRFLLVSHLLTVHGPKEITSPGSKSVGQKNMPHPMGIYISFLRKRIFLTQSQSITYCLYSAVG